MDDFRIGKGDPRTTLVTQMLWGHTTHIGCGWTQIDVGDEKFAGIYPGRYENFFVCNYGVGGNVPGEPVYQHPDCNEPGMIGAFLHLKSLLKYIYRLKTRHSSCDKTKR